MKRIASAILIAWAAVTGASAETPLFSETVYINADEAAGYAQRPADVAQLEEAMILLVLEAGNRKRAEVGLPPLSHDPALSVSAKRYSQRMRDERFFGHVAPDGEALGQRLPESEAWRFELLGENLWTASGFLNWDGSALAEHAARNWIESPSHRDNLLHNEYETAGVGVALGGDSVHVTMLYGLEHRDLGMAQLRRDHAQPPVDLIGLEQGTADALLGELNAIRASSALPSFQRDVRLDDAAKRQAQQMLVSQFSSGGDVLREVLMSSGNQYEQLASSLWTGSGALVWQDQALASTVATGWAGAADAGNDLLSGVFGDIGIGVASDGQSVTVAVIFASQAGQRLVSRDGGSRVITVQ